MRQYFGKIIAALLSMSMFFTIPAFAQNKKIFIVKDEAGNVIPGVSVKTGEKSSIIFTNEKGEFDIPDESNSVVLIEAEGYEPKLLDPSAQVEGSVMLIKAPYGMSVRDQINIPFGVFKKRQIPGAVKALDPGELLKYDEQKSIYGAVLGRVPGLFGTSNTRGLGSPLIVVDGVPRPATYLNIREVDQISVLNDLYTSLLYGSQATNGVIYISTKHGKPLKRELNFHAENGFNIPISYPKYLGASDYKTLYNEALANDGLSPSFTSEEIEKTAEGVDPVRFPDESYYNSTYLKDFSTYQYVSGEAGGGNDIAQYYTSVGWKRNTGLLKIGEGANETSNQFNVRGTVDYKITDNIKISTNGSAVFNPSKAPRYTSINNDFWVLSSTLKPTNTPVFIPASLMKDKKMLDAAKLVDGKYLLGGNNTYQSNIYGELVRNGWRKTDDKIVEMNTLLDIGLDDITPGLKFSAFLSFDLFNRSTRELANTYAVYSPNYSADTISSWTKIKTDLKKVDPTVSDAYFYRRIGVNGILNYHRIFNDHEVTVDALSFWNSYSEEVTFQPEKFLHFGIRANYMYKNKYIAELTGVYAGSGKLADSDHRWALSGGAGLGWIMTEEEFLKGNSHINYLKVRANCAINNTDAPISNYNLTKTYYNASGSYTFNQGALSNSGRILVNGNPDIGWQKLLNINLGFESRLFNYKLEIDGSYFYFKSYDELVRRANTLPVYFLSVPYDNYGSHQNQGIEFGLNYTTGIGDLQVSFGSNMVYSVPKLLAADALIYPNDSRNIIGKPSDAIIGYVALGLFKDQNDINNHASQTFGAVSPGDIKYKDLNGDNLIDENDQMLIGNSYPRVQYGLNVNLKYKSLNLIALCTGQTGQENYFTSPYYLVYGNLKYSEVVWDRWTPETASTASYPRLSSGANSNNFRNSTFWLYKNNWLMLHTVQLTYSLRGISLAGLDEADFFLRGENLTKLSKIKDKTDLNIGTAPQMRVFSLGLNLKF